MDNLIILVEGIKFMLLRLKGEITTVLSYLLVKRCDHKRVISLVSKEERTWENYLIDKWRGNIIRQFNSVNGELWS